MADIKALLAGLGLKEGNVKVINLSGKNATDVIEMLKGGATVEGEVVTPEDLKPWTKNDMIRAFGNYIDDGINRFAHDMVRDGQKPSDVYSAVQIALAHHLGMTERALVQGNEDGTDKSPLADVEAVRETHLAIGWQHKEFHFANPEAECPPNPYKLND